MDENLKCHFSRTDPFTTWNGGSYQVASQTKFVYDGWNLIAILDSANNLLQSFVWGADASGSMQGAGGVGGLISMRVHTGPQAGTYFVCYDGNWNVATLVNAANGSVAARYEYGPFGELIRATGLMAKVNPFRFSTKYTDDETDLVYYGYRYYNPSTGRWLSRDPLGEYAGYKLLKLGKTAKGIIVLGAGIQTGGKNSLISTKNRRVGIYEDQSNEYRFVRNYPSMGIDPLGLFTYDGCSSEQQKSIEDAIKANCEKADKCAGKCATKGPHSGVVALCVSKYQGYTFHCRHADPDDLEFYDPNCDAKTCGMAEQGGTDIVICPLAWDKNKCDGIGCTLFHESLHAGGNMGGDKDTHPADFETFDKCMGCGIGYKVGK